MHMRSRSLTSMFESVISKLTTSKTSIRLNSVNSSEVIGFNDLIKRNSESGKSTIFTFSSGPFKTTQELPKDWMVTPTVMGCSMQLATLEERFAELNAIVIGINKQSSVYQVGTQGLLAAKKLNHLHMISDEENKLENEFDLNNDTFTAQVNGKNYYKHFSVVVKPDNAAKGFMLKAPVTKEFIDEHIEEMKGFMGLTLTETMRNTPA